MIYLIVFAYLLILSISFDFLKVKGPKNFFYYLSMIILILIAGFRWKVGGDTLTYQSKFDSLIYPIDEFYRINFLKIGWEPGFVILNSFSKTIVPEFWFFQLLQAIFINSILFAFFKRYTPYHFTAILLYSIFYYFYFNMEILREIFSICLFIKFMYPALESKNYKKYYLFNFILLFFHTSSLILFLFPLLTKFKLNKKGIYILCAVVLFLMSLFLLFPNLINLISFSERFSNKVLIYSKYTLNTYGIISNLIMFGLFPYILLMINKKFSKKITFEILIYPYFFIVSIFIAYDGFGRFINYIGPFMIVFFVNTIYIIINAKYFRKIRLISVILLVSGPLIYKFRYYSISYDHIVKETTKFNMYYPYSSIFNREDFFQKRVIIYRQSMSETLNKSKNK